MNQPLHQRALLMWLRLVTRHLALTHAGISVVLILAANLSFLLASVHLAAWELTMLEIATVIIAVAIPSLITVLAFAHELAIVLHLAGLGPSQVFLQVIRVDLTELNDHVTDLIKGRGLKLPTIESGVWVGRRCFEVLDVQYLASDRSVPSEFRKRYAYYLDGQADYLKRTGRKDSVRVIVADDRTIVKDATAHPDDYAWFTHWHVTNEVKLMRVDVQVATDICAQMELENALDIGIWKGEVALLFRLSPKGDYVHLRMCLSDEVDYARSVSYFEEISRRAVPFPGSEVDQTGHRVYRVPETGRPKP